MVNFKSLTDKAKDLVEKRGGTDSLKDDAAELKDIAKGKGSISDKAKAAASAIKDPGAKGEDQHAANSQKMQEPSRRPRSSPGRSARRKRKAETKTEEQRAK